MVNQIEQEIKNIFGINDVIYVPENVHTKDISKYGKYFAITEDIEVLFVFNHSGLLVPKEFSEFYTADKETIKNTVRDNLDIGTRYILSYLLKNFGKLDYKYGVIFDEVSRVVADSNRLRRHEQIVERAYRGDSIWKTPNIDRSVIAESLIDPLYDSFKELIKQQKSLKFIFYVHTMDQYSGGVPSGGHELSKSTIEERPLAMIFRHYEFQDTAYGIYGSDKAANFNLLSEEQISAIQNNYVNHLGIGNIEDIKIDYPYISPRQMCGFASLYFKGPQLIFDMRKDLFRYHAEKIAQSVASIPLDVMRFEHVI